MSNELRRAVSVVVTSYNYGHLLPRALDSIRDQTEQDFEIIVVDDGSTDDTFQRARAFSDAHPLLDVILVRTRNGGASRARNLGIALARGRYITCLDADDHFAPSALERMRSALDVDPTTSVVRPQLHVFGTVEAIWDWMTVPYDFDRLCETNIAPYCAMFRRTAWEHVGGYDEGMTSWEDWNFWIALGKHGHRMGAITEPLLHHRISDGGKFAANLHRRLELISRIVCNHPDVYDAESVDLAQRVLAGKDVDDAELADPPHPIFGWSL